MYTLLAVNFGEVLLNVLAIIGIIVAGGFLIFFLGDLLLSILDPENSALRKNKNKNRQQEQERIEQKQEVLTYAPIMEEKHQEVDYDKAIEEEKMLIAPQEVEKEEELDLNFGIQEPAKTNEENLEDSFAKLREEEERYIQEKLKQANERKEEIKQEQPLENEEDDFDDMFFNDEFDFDDLVFDDEDEENNETVSEQNIEEIFEEDENVVVEFEEPSAVEEVETIEEETEETAVEEQQEVEETVEEQEIEEAVEETVYEMSEIEKELEDKNAENERLRKELEENLAIINKLKEESNKDKEMIASVELQSKEEKERLEKEKQELETLLEQAKSVAAEEETKPSLSLEEYEERLAMLTERLKANEKELRGIKKEYLPLMKVRKNLESDKKKLRRREALVAKQKVLLYGVNNIVDIDEEKARKLEEDLDLLDGLRMSVQHCEEVIKNSEERYPILETSYRILTTTNAQIKADIEEVETAIAKLKTDEVNE